MVSNHTYLEMRASTECLRHVCHPEIVLQILSSRRISFFIAAAVAAATAAAFEEAMIFPLCGGNGFPMYARKFDLRFNVVRIL